MKLRFTPLNIVCALGLCFLVLSFFSADSPKHRVDLQGVYQLLLGALIAVSFITDLIFRFTLKELKKIWMVEGFFIVFVVVLILILQK